MGCFVSPSMKNARVIASKEKGSIFIKVEVQSGFKNFL